MRALSPLAERILDGANRQLQVLAAQGALPLAPVELIPLQVRLARSADTEIADLAARLPATASKDYGTPFYEIFERYDKDFYKIDPLLFSPAEVWLQSATTGRVWHSGKVNTEVLKRSLYPE